MAKWHDLRNTVNKSVEKSAELAEEDRKQKVKTAEEILKRVVEFGAPLAYTAPFAFAATLGHETSGVTYEELNSQLSDVHNQVNRPGDRIAGVFKYAGSSALLCIGRVEQGGFYMGAKKDEDSSNEGYVLTASLTFRNGLTDAGIIEDLPNAHKDPFSFPIVTAHSAPELFLDETQPGGAGYQRISSRRAVVFGVKDIFDHFAGSNGAGLAYEKGKSERMLAEYFDAVGSGYLT